MRHEIWNNDVCKMADELKSEEEYLEMNEEQLFNTAYDTIEENLVCDIENLNIEAPGEIILIGRLVRWNGTYGVHKCLGTNNIGKAITEALGAWSGDNSFELYVEDGKMYISQLGHDNPTNPSVMEFRSLTKDYWDITDHNTNNLLAISEELGNKVANVYGWEVA